MNSEKRKTIFVSYSHRDQLWLERLQVHLHPALSYGHLDLWDDTRLKAGDRWLDAIREAIDRADVAIVLISADFMASDFIRTHELPRLLKAADERGTIVIPVHVGPSLYDHEAKLSVFQAINSPSEPLAALDSDRSEMVLVDLAKRVLEACQIKEQESRQPGRAAPAAFLPRINPDFVGRNAIVKDVTEALETHPSSIVVLEGMGGAGKTTTGVIVANRLIEKSCFRDGVVFINLEGFVDSRKPKTSEEAIEELIRPLMGTDVPLPDKPDELHRLWREMTEGLELLVFLDNAVDEDQVEPLLPGHPTVGVLMTSRNKLSLKGGTYVEIQELEEEEAKALAMDLGNRRSRNQLSASDAAELAEACGRLPLAIEVAANALSKSRGRDRQQFFGELRSRMKPATILSAPMNALRLSVEQLPSDDQVRWCQLGIFQGGFGRDAAAAVWQIDEPDELLAELERRSLIGYDESNAHYRLHDILKTLAYVLIEENAPQKHIAEKRHARFYCHELHKRAHRQAIAERPSVLELLAYYDRHRADIVAGQRWVADQLKGKRPANKDYVSSLKPTDLELWEMAADYGIGGMHMMLGRHRARHWIHWLLPWARATQILEDLAYLQPFALSKLSLALKWQMRYRRAKSLLTYADELLNTDGFPADEGIRSDVISNLGSVYLALNDPKTALAYAKKNRELKRKLAKELPEQRKNEPWSASAIGLALHHLEGAESALPYYEEHRQLAHDIGNLHSERAAHFYLGSAYMDLERYSEASASFEHSLNLSRTLGQVKTEQTLLACLAAAAQKQEDEPRALELMKESMFLSDGDETRSDSKIRKALEEFIARKGWYGPYRQRQTV